MGGKNEASGSSQKYRKREVKAKAKKHIICTFCGNGFSCRQSLSIHKKKCARAKQASPPKRGRPKSQIIEILGKTQTKTIQKRHQRSQELSEKAWMSNEQSLGFNEQNRQHITSNVRDYIEKNLYDEVKKLEIGEPYQFDISFLPLYDFARANEEIYGRKEAVKKLALMAIQDWWD